MNLALGLGQGGNMSDEQKTNNVIQFPGRKRETDNGKPEASAEAPVPSTPAKVAAGKPAAPAKKKASKKTLAGTVLAIVLASGAVNKFVFETPVQSYDFVSDSRAVNSSAGRGIASVEQFTWVRDAKWEKEMAENLASAQVRSLASTNIGRPATLEERLRWGTLEDAKYTITYKPDTRQIDSILLQGQSSDPSYILDRVKFLKEYGTLFEAQFESASLKSVESINEKTVESYTLFDKLHKATAEARFELDRHKRLISLKVEPVQI